jgi:putative ABC transport system permease protein
MISKENIIYALKNLMNRKVRSLLTILSIFVGITTIFIFISFGWGLYYYVDSVSADMGIDKIYIQARGIGAPGLDDAFKLEEKDLDTIQKTTGIVQAAGMEMATAKIVSNGQVRYSFVAGMPTNDKDQMQLMQNISTYKVDKGRNLERGDDVKVVLGYNYQVADKIFTKPLRLNDKVLINDVEFKIVGFVSEIGNPSDDTNIYLTPEAFRLVSHKDELNYAVIIAKVDNVDNIDQIVERLEKRLRQVRGLEKGKEDFFVQTTEQLIETFQTALNIVVYFIVLIAFISVIVSMINTANTMFTSILERTKEIGVLKAIGARNSEILLIFLVESSVLGCVAGIIGVTLGAIISTIGGQILAILGWSFLKPYFPLELFVGLILFATVVGTVSGLIPAYQASKNKPVDSLRYE